MKNLQAVKQSNRFSILYFIGDSGSFSRNRIAKTLEINPATASSVVNELIESSFVHEIGEVRSSGVHRPILVGIHS